VPNGIKPVLTGSPLAVPDILEQFKVLSAQGIAIAAPHLEGLRRSSAQQVAMLLGSVEISVPPSRSRFVEELLSAYLRPVFSAMRVLEHLSAQLNHPGAMPHKVPHIAHVYQLIVVILRILGASNDADTTFANAKHLLEEPKALADKLMKWHPLHGTSVQQLQSAETALLKLWPVYQTCGFHLQHSEDVRHRVLFTWGSLATSLVPLLPAARALGPVHTAVKKACEKMKDLSADMSLEDVEEATWARVRAELHRPEEPWWWLRVIGCQDPQSVYKRCGLEYSGPPLSVGYPMENSTLSPLSLELMSRAAQSWAATSKELASAKTRSTNDAGPTAALIQKKDSARKQHDISVRLQEEAYSCSFDAEVDTLGGAYTYSQDSFCKEDGDLVAESEQELDEQHRRALPQERAELTKLRSMSYTDDFEMYDGTQESDNDEDGRKESEEEEAIASWKMEERN
jgi:hypothetical protein